MGTISSPTNAEKATALDSVSAVEVIAAGDLPDTLPGEPFHGEARTLEGREAPLHLSEGLLIRDHIPSGQIQTRTAGRSAGLQKGAQALHGPGGELPHGPGYLLPPEAHSLVERLKQRRGKDPDGSPRRPTPQHVALQHHDVHPGRGQVIGGTDACDSATDDGHLGLPGESYGVFG
jgi:hypothetical protein